MSEIVFKMVTDFGRIKGLVYAIDKIIDAVEFKQESLDTADNLVSVFYVLMDEVNRVEKDIRLLEENN